MKPAVHGLWPALLLPVDPRGALDTARAMAHARRMLGAGCDGITLFGTTGEGPAFSVAERCALLEAMLACGIAADQILVTTTAVALPDAVALGRHALAHGVRRQMFMPPFYFNQPRDEGIVAAVSQLVEGIAHADLRLLLYHFPAMSTFGFSHAAIAELVRRHPAQVVGLKDSGGDLAHSLQLVAAFPALSILVGTEDHIAPVMVAGGAGSINGLGNVAPHLMRRVVSAPGAVRTQDRQGIDDMLHLLRVRPGLPFVGVYKQILAAQLDDPQWLNMRAPLSCLHPDEAAAVVQAYHALGPLLPTL